METHPQVAIRPLTYVDEGIAPLVLALSEVGLHTVFSCQGMKSDPHEQRAYVRFNASRRKAFRLIRHLQDAGAPDDAWELAIGADGTYTLYVAPQNVEIAAQTIFHQEVKSIVKRQFGILI